MQDGDTMPASDQTRPMKTIISTVTVKDLSELEWDASNVHYVSVDSRDRNKELYPDPNSYTITFPDKLTNVLQVELVYAQYEKYTNEAYINLIIDECAPNTLTLNNATYNTNAFTQLPVTQAFNEYTRNMFRSIKRFAPPKPSMTRMTISFRTSTGLRGGVKDHFLRFEIRSLPVRADYLPRHPSGTQEELLRVLTKLARRMNTLDEASRSLERAAHVMRSHTERLAFLSSTQDSKTNMNDKDKDKVEPLLNTEEAFAEEDGMAADKRRRFAVLGGVAAVAATGAAGYVLARKRWPEWVPGLPALTSLPGFSALSMRGLWS